MTARGDGGGEAFWRFSLAFHARPGIPEALVRLQDRNGLDVNVILYALWLGLVRGYTVTETELAAAEHAAAPLRDAVVAELRALRRRLRANPDPDIQALRRRVQGLEIAAERAVQERLAGSLTPIGPASTNRAGVALANLGLCLGPAAHSPEAEVIRAAAAGFSRRA